MSEKIDLFDIVLDETSGAGFNFGHSGSHLVETFPYCQRLCNR